MPEAEIRFIIALLTLAAALAGCTSHTTATARSGNFAAPRPGEFAPRVGDEIVVCGHFVHTGVPVVTWMDPGGYDAYRTERRFATYKDSAWGPSTQAVKELSSPNRYGLRAAGLSPEQIDQ